MTAKEFKIDTHSALWLNLKAYIDGRLAEHRLRLEGTCPWEDVIQLRARVLELKTLLALAKHEAPLAVQDFELPE